MEKERLEFAGMFVGTFDASPSCEPISVHLDDWREPARTTLQETGMISLGMIAEISWLD